ncbi:quaternary ammonium compound-resistance protein SugE [Arcanobacterium pluranimalium]|uniref:DMT family transporter n=1 Tax=Arcanobacterium pluranimalium TaxID=108028 RepID=UPI00195AB407|nr:SMR family transporter [Arcanobacterium pluranimalium]MBM7825410.1 quaternary ammonium compound-resistance protein SugE [Arcanobacterium pluranimalium]
MFAWLVLLLAGIAEAAWAVALAESQGFKKRVPTGIFFGFLVLSMLGLGYAMKYIPTATAYAVWTGIGASITAIVSLARKQEKFTLAKLLLLLLLISCIVGLKVLD